jgi:triacylglycerol lipase
MNTACKHLVAASLLLAASWAQALVPPDLAEKLAAIGTVINPAATAPLYAGRISGKEPDVNTRVERDLSYGPNERNLLDVFWSGGGDAADKRAVVVFVHGGAFVGGNRRTGPGSPFYDNVMQWAVHNGMVGVNMTYRLAPKDPWPAGPEDIARALRWVRENIASRGGDPRRVFLLGHSAGASHVAAYVARPAFAQSSGTVLAGAMLLSGVYRITPELVAQSPTYPLYFGTEAERYPERSSLDGLIATSTPLWVGSAELDPPGFKEQAELLRSELRKAGRRFGSADFSAHSHMSEAYSIHSDDRSVGDALLAFVRGE